MALPTKSVNWTYSLNNRITYSSLVQVARDLMFLVKTTLVAAGYTVKGSSNGAAGGMDYVDRWTTAADAGTRGTTTTTPISWIVLTDGNGADVLIAYIGATDDVFRVNVSHAGDYAVAGTATHQPTSSNEQNLNGGYFTTPLTMINATTSADRVVHLWTAPLARGFRVAVFRASALVCAFGVDTHDTTTYAPSVSVSAGHGFFLPGGLVLGSVLIDPAVSGNASSAFRVVVRTSMGARLASCGRVGEVQGYGTTVSNNVGIGQDFIPELQGEGFQLKRMGLISTLTSSRGRVGNLRDWWFGRSGAGAADGDHYGTNREFVCIQSTCGIVWPWDGTPTTPGSAIAIA